MSSLTAKYIEDACDGYAVRATRIVNGLPNEGEKAWLESISSYTKKPVHVFCMTQEEKQDFIYQEVLAKGKENHPSYVYHVFRDVYQPGCKYGRENMLVNACSTMYAVDEKSFARAFDPTEWKMIQR